MAGIASGKPWSRIGAETAPTSSAAPGVWGDLNEVAEAIEAGNWPGPPKGFVLLWGDPDNAGGVSAETYPYDIEFLADGTTARLGGRYSTSTANSARLATGEIDLSGGPTTAPTTATGQLGWNFTHNSPTYGGIYNHAGAMWVDGSDNMYQCGRSYDASYGYNNTGIIKANSSQSVQWNVAYKANNSYPYGFRDGIVWKSETSGYVGMMGVVYDYRNGSYKQRYQMLGLSDSDGSVTHGKVGRPVDDTYTASMTNGNPYRSNFQGDKFATIGGYYNSGYYQTITTMLWTAQSNNFQNEWTIGNHSIRNSSTGGSDMFGTGVCLDSNENVYIVSSFNAQSITASANSTNVAISKYNSSGTYQWTYVLRQQAGGEDTGMTAGGIDISADDNDIFISGYSTKIGSTSINGPFIAKLDVSGSTPSLTWINHYSSATYNCYSQNCKVIGTDTVVSFGYGQTDPSSNVVGVLISANQDGSTTGSGTVDGIAWTAVDLSPYIVFADGASGGTANVNITHETSTTFTYSTATETTTASTPTWTSGAPSPTIQVESGPIG